MNSKATFSFFALSIVSLLFLLNSKYLSSGVQFGLIIFSITTALIGINSFKNCFENYEAIVEFQKSYKEIQADNNAYEKDLKNYNIRLKEVNDLKEKIRKAEEDKIEKIRLEELRYEFVKIITVSNDTALDVYYAIALRSDNTYAHIKKNKTPYKIGENLKIERIECEKLIWMSEIEYRKQESQLIIRKDLMTLLEKHYNITQKSIYKFNYYNHDISVYLGDALATFPFYITIHYRTVYTCRFYKYYKNTLYTSIFLTEFKQTNGYNFNVLSIPSIEAMKIVLDCIMIEENKEIRNRLGYIAYWDSRHEEIKWDDL